MPRGKRPAIYASDSGEEFGTQVDEDLFLQAGRGWTAMPPGTNRRRFPVGFRPRMVQGIDAEGYRGTAVVGSNVAGLWTGTVTEFDIEGSDGQLHTMAVTNRVGESGGLVAAPPGVAAP